MPLTDTAIRTFKPMASRYRKADGAGLCLLVCPDGSKSWTFRYRFAGKEKGVSFGAYPAVPLLAAREKHKAALALIRAGKDPSFERKAEKHAKNSRRPTHSRPWRASTLRSKPNDGPPARLSSICGGST